MKSKLLNYLFWLIIAAAFIGPGTVTTAASAGAGYQYQLLWAMVFSIVACMLLQEAAARIAVMSGKSLGEAIKQRFTSSAYVWLIGIAIFLGCIAYEAGNILGAISGLALLNLGLPQWVFTTIIVVLSALLLYTGKTKLVPNILGGLVAIMGIGLFYAAFSVQVDVSAMLKGFVSPQIPEGGTLIVLGLIGTTIVPYNIFLGSGLAQGKDLKTVRSGLIPSILIGGLISIAVIIVGAALQESFSFEALYAMLTQTHGNAMGFLFAFGLFGAGFTSTITAALAGAITIRSIHPKGKNWSDTSKQFRLLWFAVVVIGFAFGVSGIKPVPVIIAAQAANGFILPLLTLSIWVVVNNRDIVKAETNRFLLNLGMAFTLFVTAILGLLNMFKAGYATAGASFSFVGVNKWVILALALAITLFGVRMVLKERKLTFASF